MEPNQSCFPSRPPRFQVYWRGSGWLSRGPFDEVRAPLESSRSIASRKRLCHRESSLSCCSRLRCQSFRPLLRLHRLASHRCRPWFGPWLKTRVQVGSAKWSGRIVPSSWAHSSTFLHFHWLACQRWSCRAPCILGSASPESAHCFPPGQCYSSKPQSIELSCWRMESRRFARRRRRSAIPH